MDIILSKKEDYFSMNELELLISKGYGPEYIKVEEKNGDIKFSLNKATSIDEVQKILKDNKTLRYKSSVRFLDSDIFQCYTVKVADEEFENIKELNKIIPGIIIELVDLNEEFSTILPSDTINYN